MRTGALLVVVSRLLVSVLQVLLVLRLMLHPAAGVNTGLANSEGIANGRQQGVVRACRAP